jgi:nitric oxide reductase NorD protein
VAEPEDVIAEGVLHATRLARELWARRTAGSVEAPPRLKDLRRRLELFVAAVFPEAPDIGIAEPPAPPSLLARLARRRTSHLHSRVALPCSDGASIRLPRQLDALPRAEIADRYRLLALEQAARIHRGTRAGMPAGDALLRDLYLLSEAAAVDALLVRMFPRFAPGVREARREAAAGRPVVRRPSPREAAVELLVQRLLAAEPGLAPAPFAVAATPEASRRWAGEQRLTLLDLPGSYRGMAPVPVWGAIHDTPEAPGAAAAGPMDENTPAPGRARTLSRRPRTREAGPDEDDAEPGTWMVRADDLQEKAEDPAGLHRPADRDQQADPGDLADALSELPEARLVRTPGPVSEVLAGEDPIPRAPAGQLQAPASGLAYPEWDWRVGAYRARAAVVRASVAEAGSEAWVHGALSRHATMIRAVRRDFERLRPRRMALRHQPDGAELDVDALVAAYADRHAGSVPDDRFHVDTRPVRRDAAIALLVDASASTDGWVAGDRRIIDVEKEALLIVGEALAALGDPHAMLAFASAGPARVTVRMLKQFEEPAGAGEVRRRIAGLEPDGYTRVGAALRHATAGLGRLPARHRLLLLLSDGRPNDLDQYEGRYGIEDTRMAVAEARLQGVHVFCLTVDRQAPRYATRIFGRDFAVLSRAERLPRVMTALLRHLVRG